MEKLEHALSESRNHLLKSKIAYLEGDFQKAVQHATIAGDIASYTIFCKVGGVERIIAGAEHKISELEALLKSSRQKVE